MKSILAIGSNIGDRALNLKVALAKLQDHFNITSRSSIYESVSLLKDNQQNYYNMVIEIFLEISSTDLLSIIKNIETVMGRVDNGRWQERIIDIDILTYNDEIINNDILTIPHLELNNRSFVLYPLKEILPDFTDIRTGKNIDILIRELKEDFNIKKINL